MSTEKDFTAQPEAKKKKNKSESADNQPKSFSSLGKKLTVEGMTCENCVIRVENALNFQPGAWAKADLKTGTVLLRLKNDIPEEELRAILKDVGYEMTGAETL